MFDSEDDYTTVAYNATTGKGLWTTVYNGPGFNDDDAVALGMSRDGSKVFVSGFSLGSTFLGHNRADVPGAGRAGLVEGA